MAAIQFKDTCLIVGGKTSATSQQTNEVLEYDPIFEEFFLRPESLVESRYGHSATFVDDSVVRCTA